MISCLISYGHLHMGVIRRKRLGIVRAWSNIFYEISIIDDGWGHCLIATLVVGLLGPTLTLTWRVRNFFFAHHKLIGCLSNLFPVMLGGAGVTN
jgi:hypothetical protein